MTQPALPIRTLAEVVSLSAEGASNYRLTLRVDGWPGFEPGQFAMISPGPQGAVPRSDPLLTRPANVDCFFSRCVPWHEGHSGISPPRTSVSKRCSHA